MHAELQVGVRPLRPRPSLSSSLRCTRRRPEAVQAKSLGICGAPDSQDREFDAILHTFGRQGLSGSFTAMKFSCPASLPGLRPPHARVASWPASHQCRASKMLGMSRLDRYADRAEELAAQLQPNQWPAYLGPAQSTPHNTCPHPKVWVDSECLCSGISSA